MTPTNPTSEEIAKKIWNEIEVCEHSEDEIRVITRALDAQWNEAIEQAACCATAHPSHKAIDIANSIRSLKRGTNEKEK